MVLRGRQREDAEAWNHNLMTGENLELGDALPEQPGDALPEGWSWQRSRQTRRVYLYNRVYLTSTFPRVWMLSLSLLALVHRFGSLSESYEARCREYWGWEP